MSSNNPPRLQVSNLPIAMTNEEPTTSPARGAEMRNFLQARLLHNNNRAPPLVHSWDFWHDRQDRQQQPKTESNTTYEARLEHLATVSDVRQFWSVFNNLDLHRLALRDTLHLFHATTQPIWEHPRNRHGGAWTFRVPHALAADFWKEICLMAIGEQLQGAVEEGGRRRFRDDICGVSLATRFRSVLVQVWNRDGRHAAGIERVLETVVQGLSVELRPREGSFYYKRHCEHAGFAGETTAAGREGLEME